jgi:hypothetical protein
VRRAGKRLVGTDPNPDDDNEQGKGGTTRTDEHERGRRFSMRLAPLARTDDDDDDENG